MTRTSPVQYDVVVDVSNLTLVSLGAGFARAAKVLSMKNSLPLTTGLGCALKARDDHIGKMIAKPNVKHQLDHSVVKFVLA